MKTPKPIIFFLLVLSALAGEIKAQRYIPGMSGIVLHGGITERPGFYAEIGYSTYTARQNRWNFGINYLTVPTPYHEMKIPLVQTTATAGFYKRIIQDRRRTFFLSIGLDAIIGYEWVNWGQYNLPDGGIILDRNRFVFGGALSLEAEYYLNDRYILLVRIRERCLGNSDVGLWHTEAGVGLKVMIR